MARPTQPLLVAAFAGLSDDLTVEGSGQQAEILQNLYRIHRKLVRRGGSNSLGTGPLAPDQALTGIQWTRLVTTSGTTDFLLAGAAGHLVDWLAPVPGTRLASGTNRLSPTGSCSFAWVERAVYAGEGINPNVVFDGVKVATAGVPPATGSGMTPHVGGAGVLTGVYSYRVAFLANSLNPGEPSFISDAASVTVSAQQIALSGIPVCPAPYDCSGRRLYRTKNGGTTWYFVADLADNTSTSYADNVSDASLGLPVIEGNTMFPPTKLVAEHQSRLLGAACAVASGGDLKTLYISNTLQPYYCPLLPNYNDVAQGIQLPIQGPGAGEITGLASVGAVACVFTASHGYLLLGEDVNSFALQRFTHVGCAAHKTLAFVKGQLIWLAGDGHVYAWSAGPYATANFSRAANTEQRLSEDVRYHLTALSASGLAACHAAVFNDRYYLFYPGGGFYYDLTYGQWGQLTGWDFNASTVGVYTGSTLPRFFGALTGHARAVELEVGTTDNGAAIDCLWRSNAWQMGRPGGDKRVHRLDARAKVAASGSATVRLYRGGGELVQTESWDLSAPVNPGSDTTRLLRAAVQGARDELFQLEVECSGASEFELTQAGVHFTIAT